MKRSITDYFSRSVPAASKQSKGKIIENKRKSNYVRYIYAHEMMKQKPTDVKLTKKRTLHCHRPALKKSGAKLPLTCLCYDNMQCCSYVINFKSLMTRRGCTGSIQEYSCKKKRQGVNGNETTRQIPVNNKDDLKQSVPHY